MIWVYFDASALVKRYSFESGTNLVNELFQNLPVEQITCSVIGVLEIVSVLVRKRNDGRISPNSFKSAMNQLNGEVIEADDFSLAAIDNFLAFSALNLIEKHNINSTDAMILQSCLNIQREQSEVGNLLVLWSCDKRLLKAAQDERLDVFDPETGTRAQLQSLLANH